MKLGAERKKVVIFAVLVVVAILVYWMNSSSGAPPAAATARPAADPTAVAAGAPPAADGITRAVKKRVATGKGGNLSEFVPKSPDTVDPAKVDPTLRLDLLAKVQGINVEGGVRNLFQFCMDCAAKEAAAAAAAAAAKEIPKVDPIHPNPQPAPPPPVTAQVAPPSGPPPTPPINLKYYGYSTTYSNEKKAFFLDGDDVIVAAEGEIIKKQYKIVRINVNSVQMEDTASKSTQTLPMQQDAPV
jgi:hypothetical protein